jgi:hypothetical protein
MESFGVFLLFWFVGAAMLAAIAWKGGVNWNRNKNIRDRNRSILDHVDEIQIRWDALLDRQENIVLRWERILERLEGAESNITKLRS